MAAGRPRPFGRAAGGGLDSAGSKRRSPPAGGEIVVIAIAPAEAEPEARGEDVQFLRGAVVEQVTPAMSIARAHGVSLRAARLHREERIDEDHVFFPGFSSTLIRFS